MKKEYSMDNSDITCKTEKKRNLIYNNKNVYIYKINNFYDAYIAHWCF